jgi:hypothetical protein
VSILIVAGAAAEATQDAPIRITTSERFVMRDSMAQSGVRGP